MDHKVFLKFLMKLVRASLFKFIPIAICFSRLFWTCPNHHTGINDNASVVSGLSTAAEYCRLFWQESYSLDNALTWGHRPDFYISCRLKYFLCDHFVTKILVIVVCLSYINMLLLSHLGRKKCFLLFPSSGEMFVLSHSHTFSLSLLWPISYTDKQSVKAKKSAAKATEQM